MEIGRALLSFAALFPLACGSQPTESTPVVHALRVEAAPRGSVFDGQVVVQLKSDRPAQIFYTTDGDSPARPDAMRYEGPLELSDLTLVSFVALGEDGTWSQPQAELYTPLKKLARPLPVARALIPSTDNIYFFANQGDDVLERSFTIRSLGLERVHVKGIYLAVNPSGWSFYEEGVFGIRNDTIFGETGVFLEPGQSMELTVTYRPSETLRSAVVVIQSDDQREEEGYLLVELWGRIRSW